MNAKEEYLTKRVVICATGNGMKKAAKETVDTMGYNVIAQKDGLLRNIRTEALSLLKKLKYPPIQGRYR